MQVAVVGPVAMVQAAILGIDRPCQTESIILRRLHAHAKVERLITGVRVVAIRRKAIDFTIRIIDPALHAAVAARKPHAVIGVFADVPAVIAVVIPHIAGAP